MLMRHRKKNRRDGLYDDDKKPKEPKRPKKRNVLIPNNTTLRKLPAQAIKRLAKRLDIEYTTKPEAIAAIIEVRDSGE